MKSDYKSNSVVLKTLRWTLFSICFIIIAAHCKFDGECRSGRMCKDNICVCLPEDGCKGHFKPVCGSDGLKYTSHCELHRAACISGIHIKVDLSGNCFVKREFNKN